MTDPYESIVCAMFRDAGWNAKVTQHTGDHGIDVIAEMGDEVILVQCKDYSGHVGEKYVRELFGVLSAEIRDPKYAGKTVGAMLVASNGCTNEAMEWASDKPGLMCISTRELSRHLKVPIPQPYQVKNGIRVSGDTSYSPARVALADAAAIATAALKGVFIGLATYVFLGSCWLFGFLVVIAFFVSCVASFLA